MAASSRAQVLDLYRAMLRESKHFSAYNYRSSSANCIPQTSLLLRSRRSPGPREPGPACWQPWTTFNIHSVHGVDPAYHAGPRIPAESSLLLCLPRRST
nr:LYR motif-containing protein 4 isoform X2 [Loxodonta africana]